MKSLIRKCKRCGIYTMKSVCDICGEETVMAIPPRYSPVDRFQKYRLKEKGELIGKNNTE